MNSPAALYWAIVIGSEARITGEHFENVEELKTMSDNDGRTDECKWVEEEVYPHPWAGHNMNRCAGCGTAFVGDKRTVNCLACMWKAYTQRGLTLATISDMVSEVGALDGMELVKAVGAVTGEREGLRSVIDRLREEFERLQHRFNEAIEGHNMLREALKVAIAGGEELKAERDELRAQLAAIHNRAEQLQAEADWPDVVLEQLEVMKGERDEARADLAAFQALIAEQSPLIIQAQANETVLRAAIR